MRILSGFVITALLLHLQCAGSCVFDSFASKTPPCHKHGHPQQKSQEPARDSSGPCDQVQLNGAKSGAAGKSVLQCAAVPQISAVSLAPDTSGTPLVPLTSDLIWTPAVPLSALRI